MEGGAKAAALRCAWGLALVHCSVRQAEQWRAARGGAAGAHQLLQRLRKLNGGQARHALLALVRQEALREGVGARGGERGWGQGRSGR